VRWLALSMVALALIGAASVQAAIPPAERQALLDLYNSTNGPGWTNNTGWGAPAGTECTWYGVTCDAGETTVVQLVLSDNGLSGSIPAGLDNLSGLQVLNLSFNQLTGGIPPELSQLSTLQMLDLGWNELSGPIPPQLGNLVNLQYLLLQSNKLSGSIPSSLTGLTNLGPGWLSIQSNALYTSDPALIAFLNSHQDGGDWQSSQTIAPTGVAAAPGPGNTQALVSWTPILFIAGGGGYRVSYALTSGGPYTFFGMTPDKTSTSLVVTGLAPGTTYYFIVESQTDPSVNNQHTVVSDPSAEVSATTLANPIPTLEGAGMIVFILALALAGLAVIRRQVV
jgi:hypothetical protein